MSPPHPNISCLPKSWEYFGADQVIMSEWHGGGMEKSEKVEAERMNAYRGERERMENCSLL